jgi:hypothetical protein
VDDLLVAPHVSYGFLNWNAHPCRPLPHLTAVVPLVVLIGGTARWCKRPDALPLLPLALRGLVYGLARMYIDGDLP